MLYRRVEGSVSVPFPQVGVRGTGHGVQRVTKDPTSEPKPLTDAPLTDAPLTGSKANGAASGEKDHAGLPDPVWNADIRAYYDAVVEEPVPQEFVDLLAEIAKDIPE